MASRINLFQLRSKFRQLESKRRQAINRYNQKVRDLKRAVDRYNREVRAYNSRLRSHQQRVRTEFTKLQRKQSSGYSTLRVSVSSLHSTYTRLEQSVSSRILTPQENYFLDLSERENANSINVLNTLLSPENTQSETGVPQLQQTEINDDIAVISEDLDSRWRGALYSLSPSNPDASRHFCASAREIFTEILDLKAPDNSVEDLIPDCQKTDLGTPTRRSKIKYLLLKKEIPNDLLAEFVDNDIDNIIKLFDVLNTGTHGAAGRYDLETLSSIKKRVEDGLMFLSRIAV